MPLLRPSTLVSYLLFTASVAVAGCVVLVGRASEPASAAAHEMFAVGLAQIALLAAWLAWGRRPVLLRVTALAGGLAFWSWPMAHWIANGYAHWLFVLTAYATSIITVLAILRMTGVAAFGSVTLSSDGRTSPGAQHASWQFSLWTLLSLMTAAAVVVALMRWAAIPWESLGEAGVFIASFTILAFASLLVGAGLRRPSRVLLAVIALAFLGALWFSLFGATRHYLLICGVLSGYIALSMQALRTVGLRLHAAGRETTAAAPHHSEFRATDSRRAA
jgi:hypothetical protein